MKRLAILSLSLLLLLVFIPGCFTVQIPASPATPSSGTPAVIGTFSSNPAAINPGGTTTLMWNVIGANSVSIDNGIGQVSAVGSRVISPATSTVYTISATNSAGTVTKSVVTTVSSAPITSTPISFAVTSIIANTDPSTFTGACPKTFTFYVTITANGSGTVTYRWERNDGRNSDPQSVTFYGAGTKTTTMQADLTGTSSGWYRAHVLSPNDIASIPVYYTLNCDSGSFVTGIVVGVDQYPFTGPCPKTIHFWGTISAGGPGTVTYRWERSDGTASATEVITFTGAGSQTVTNLWTRGEGSGWQLLHVLTPNDAVSSPINFVMTCWNQSQ